MFLRKYNTSNFFVDTKKLTEVAFVTQTYSNHFDESCGLQQIAVIVR